MSSTKPMKNDNWYQNNPFLYFLFNSKIYFRQILETKVQNKGTPNIFIFPWMKVHKDLYQV